MAKLLWFVLVISALAGVSEGARILLVFPFPSRSHNNLGEGILRILHNAGHEITYMTPFPKQNTKNVRYVDVSEILNALDDDIIKLKDVFDKKESSIGMNMLKQFISGSGGFFNLPTDTLKTKNVQKFLNDPNEKFDLVIIEWLLSETYVGIPAVFNCPYIWVSSTNPHWMVLSLIDEITNPAYNPEMMSTNIPPLNFSQRVSELINYLFWGVLRTFIMTPKSVKAYNEIYGPIFAKKGSKMPTYDEMVYNASLMFGNTHTSLATHQFRLPQNFKSIGGYHIDPNVKPLPEDLKKLMDNAKDGVIYFSLGSNVKSRDFPDVIKTNLLKMFSGLKYIVIWKFEDELPDVPKNVYITKWAPQPGILNHPNCKLFISHGGLLSTTETVHFGVPVIGIPVFADQFLNVEGAVKRGFALKVDISYNLADDLKIAIEEIFGNPKYKKKIDELNFIYHDRPVKPAQELLHWVNHVIRTNGAEYLRSVALLVPWYQKIYLDFLAVLIVVIFVFIKAIKLLCCSKKKSLKDKKKQH